MKAIRNALENFLGGKWDEIPWLRARFARIFSEPPDGLNILCWFLWHIYEIACWLKSVFEDINAIDSAEKMEIFMIDLDIQLYDHLNRHMKTFRPRIRRAIRYLENEGEDWMILRYRTLVGAQGKLERSFAWIPGGKKSLENKISWPFRARSRAKLEESGMKR